MLAGAVIGLGCGLPTDGCGCPPTPASATVFGRVQTADGAPVARAVVLAYIAQADDCGRRDSPDGSAVTQANGTYSVWVVGDVVDTASTCVRVRVRAPLESGLVDAPDTTVSLAFRYTDTESARVDATLGSP